MNCKFRLAWFDHAGILRIVWSSKGRRPTKGGRTGILGALRQWLICIGLTVSEGACWVWL
jgi:hypothetical protein